MRKLAEVLGWMGLGPRAEPMVERGMFVLLRWDPAETRWRSDGRHYATRSDAELGKFDLNATGVAARVRVIG